MEKKEILSTMYENIAQENPPTSEYIRLQEQFTKKREQFLQKLGEENRTELESVTSLLYAMGKELEKQSFIERIFGSYSPFFGSYK